MNNYTNSFNRIVFDIGEMSPKDFLSMQVVINAYCYQLEVTNTGSVYHVSPGYCDLNITASGVKDDRVFIALESGIIISSQWGGPVQYIVPGAVAEYIVNEYETAINKLNELKNL